MNEKESELEYYKNFGSKFNKLDREISSLRNDMREKKGILLRVHIRSKDELRDEIRSGKINSILKKIEDDVDNWDQRKRLSDISIKMYQKDLEAYSKKLDEVKKEIQERRDTFYEMFTTICNELASLALTTLPTVARFAEVVVGSSLANSIIAPLLNQISLVKGLLTGRKRETPLLPPGD